jgi:hypothetical protein
LEIYRAEDRLLHTYFTEHLAKPGVLEMFSVDVHDPAAGRNVWLAHNHPGRREISIHDHRERLTGYKDRPMTDSDVALCEFADPRFGDFNDLWRRVETYLQNEGFGSLRENFEC